MPYTIAVAGKGGVGKTTLTGMMIQYLADKKEGPIWQLMPMRILI